MATQLEIQIEMQEHTVSHAEMWFEEAMGDRIRAEEALGNAQNHERDAAEKLEAAKALLDRLKAEQGKLPRSISSV